MRVLAAGAGGVLGREIVRALNKKGIEVVGLAYSKAEFAGIENMFVKTIACDVTKPQELEGVCRGVDIVISTIGITRISANLSHIDVDYQGNVNLLEEARKDGVKKMVFISPAGVELGSTQVPLFNAKYLFEKHLKYSGINWLIFQSGGFYIDLAEYGKTASKGALYVINKGVNKFTPIDVGELADIMVEDMLVNDNKVIEVGGPEDLSWRDICTECCRALGVTPKFRSVPDWLCNLILAVIRPFSHKYYAMGKLLVFTSTHDLPTPKRGKIRFADFVKEYYRNK